MKRIMVFLGFLSGVLTGFQPNVSGQTTAAWTTLFNGGSLDAFTPTGNANWKVVDGVVQADSGTGFLVTKQAYGDFEMKLEFWVDDAANSGVFIRCADPQKIGADSCYEVNIFDKRPDPAYPGWTLRLLFPRSAARMIASFEAVARDELTHAVWTRHDRRAQVVP